MINFKLSKQLEEMGINLDYLEVAFVKAHLLQIPVEKVIDVTGFLALRTTLLAKKVIFKNNSLIGTFNAILQAIRFSETKAADLISEGKDAEAILEVIKGGHLLDINRMPAEVSTDDITFYILFYKGTYLLIADSVGSHVKLTYYDMTATVTRVPKEDELNIGIIREKLSDLKDGEDWSDIVRARSYYSSQSTNS